MSSPLGSRTTTPARPEMPLRCGRCDLHFRTAPTPSDGSSTPFQWLALKAIRGRRSARWSEPLGKLLASATGIQLPLAEAPAARAAGQALGRYGCRDAVLHAPRRIRRRRSGAWFGAVRPPSRPAARVGRTHARWRLSRVEQMGCRRAALVAVSRIPTSTSASAGRARRASVHRCPF